MGTGWEEPFLWVEVLLNRGALGEYPRLGAVRVVPNFDHIESGNIWESRVTASREEAGPVVDSREI